MSAFPSSAPASCRFARRSAGRRPAFGNGAANAAFSLRSCRTESCATAKKSKAFLNGISLLAASLLLAGCGRRERAGEPAADRAQAGPLAYPASDYIERAPGKPGGTLRVTGATDPGTLDYQITASTPVKWLGRLLFDNLVYLDDKGNITPWLAKSWDISPDGLSYTFRLREDVTFSDGTPLDAETVKLNLDRMRDPATKTAMTTAYIAPYARGVVVDRHTFRAELSAPYTPFLTVLAQSWLGLYSGKAIRDNAKGLGDRPVGSGPFVLESYTRQQGVKFVRRNDYRWAPAFVRHEGPAYLDRIEYEFVPEALVRYRSLEAGQSDFTLDAPAQNAAAIRADENLVLHSRVNLGNPWRAITFNVEKFPFDDVRVRKAFTLAVDREGLERITGFGEYRLTTGFLSALTPYYDSAYANTLKTDVAGANALLDAAGWTARDAEGFRVKNGVRLAAAVSSSESQSPGATLVALQSDARAIGFELKIVQVPATQLTVRRRSGDYQALGPGFWHTNTPDGLYIVYHGKNISGEYTGQNVSRIADPELDTLLTKTRATRDPAELKSLYSQAQRRLTEIVPAVPVYENHTLVAHRKGVKGTIFDTSHNTPYFLTTRLEN